MRPGLALRWSALLAAMALFGCGTGDPSQQYDEGDEADFIDQELGELRWIQPKTGDILSGTITLEVDPPNKTQSVTFMLDGASFAVDKGRPWSATLDTTNAENREHRLKAVARNASGRVIGRKTLRVVFSNGATTAPAEPEPADPAEPTDPEPEPSCGDGTCGSHETCSSCAADCGKCPTTDTGGVVYKGLWISKAELDSLPMSGTGWTQLKNAADSSWPTPNVSENNDKHNVYTLAGALVYARLHPSTSASAYRQKVRDAIARAIGTEDVCSQNTSIGRNTLAYVIAADLIHLPAYDAALDSKFRSWITLLRDQDVSSSCHSMVKTHESRLSNHGTVHGASRVAVDLYLGSQADLSRAWTVWQSWYGDTSKYSGMDYNGGLTWFAGTLPPNAPGINPMGATKLGVSIDGALPAEMDRGAAFTTGCPTITNYPWGALQGAAVVTELLHRAGFPAKRASDRAIKRAYEYFRGLTARGCSGWWPSGSDNQWQPALANYMYCTDWPEFSNAGHGKVMGWTEWTHGSRKSADCGN